MRAYKKHVEEKSRLERNARERSRRLKASYFGTF